MQYRHELVIPSESYTFRMFLFEGKDGNYRVSKHWHESIEIFLVLEGQMAFYINNECFEIGTGDFMIVNSNEIHSIDCPDLNETVVLQIPLEAFDGYLEGRSGLQFEKQGEQLNKQLQALVHEMYLCHESRHYGYKLMVKSLFLKLLYLLVTEFKEDMDEAMVIQKKQLMRLSTVILYMREHYQEDLTLDEVANQFGFTPTYLSRMFKKYADINYLTYLQDLRVEFAVRELLNSEEPIGMIAIHHGFADHRAFTKAFRKRYDCLPSEFRKVQKSALNELKKCK